MKGLLATVAFCLAAIPAVWAVQHQVTVGGPGVLRFDPQFLDAVSGDTVLFTFKQKNHTATQSTFDNPCSPVEGGFDSGFTPVGDSVTTDFPTSELPVTDDSPIWIYCAQVGHCQQGMVFAVNPGDQFPEFQAAAATGAGSTTIATSSTTSSSTGTGAATTSASQTTSGTATATSPPSTGTRTSASGSASGTRTSASGTATSQSGADAVSGGAGTVIGIVAAVLGILI